jgi:Multimeric flavodoxin WrbA
MIGAEGVVLGSPVYIDNVTAQMKAFIDRLADAIHYQVLTGAYGCSVATTWGSGGNEVVAYLDHVLHYLGAQTITGLSVSLGDNESALPQARVQAWECGKNLVETIQHQRRFPDQEKIITENREFFARIVKENRYSRPREYREWVKKGWIPEE